MTRPAVSRTARRLDAAGLLCMVGGAGGYGWSWLRMRELQQAAPATLRAIAGGEPFGALAQWSRLQTTSHVALGFVALGVGLAVVAAAVARRDGAAPPAHDTR